MELSDRFTLDMTRGERGFARCGKKKKNSLNLAENLSLALLSMTRHFTDRHIPRSRTEVEQKYPQEIVPQSLVTSHYVSKFIPKLLFCGIKKNSMV
jgi:hypothetical protein